MGVMAMGIRSSVAGTAREGLAATLKRSPVGRLVFAVPLKMRRAEPLRPAGRSPRSLGPRLAADGAPPGAEPATFDLGSGPYGWHGTGRITIRSIAGAAGRASASGHQRRALAAEGLGGK